MKTYASRRSHLAGVRGDRDRMARRLPRIRRARPVRRLDPLRLQRRDAGAADCHDRARARAIPAGVALSGCVRRRVLAVLRNRLCIVARFRRPRACRGGHAGMGRLDDEHRLRRASSPPGDLRASGGVARGDRDGVCRGGHVPRSGAHAGARSPWLGRIGLRALEARSPRDPQSHGAVDLSRHRLGRGRRSNARTGQRLSPNLGGRLDGLRSLRHRPWRVDGRPAGQHWPLGRARGGQARTDAAHRPWPFDRAPAGAAHPHRGRRVRGGSDRQDGLHPFRRISLRGGDRRRDHFSHDIVLDRHAHRWIYVLSTFFPLA